MDMSFYGPDQTIFRGKSGKRTLTFHNEHGRQMAHELLDELDMDKPWDFEVKRYRKQRTLPQNSLLHLWFGIVAEFNGDTQASVKHDLTAKFSELIKSKITGEWRPRSTSEMDTLQMTEFIDRIYAWATTDMDLILPIPEDQDSDG